MSDDQSTPPTPPPPPPSRWTPQAVIGLLCLVAASVLRRVLDDDTGRDLADALMFLGGSLVGWAPPLPAVKPTGGKGGGGTTGLLVGCILASLAMLAPGCGTVERNGDVLAFQLRPDPERPRPACLYRLTVDGELVHYGAIDECPAVPVCEEPQR